MDISLAAEPIFHAGSFAFTNTLLVSWVIVLFLALLAVLLPRRLAAVPRGLQNLWEALIEAGVDFMESVIGSREDAIKFFPVVMTIFLLVLFANLIEVVPGLGTIGLREIHDGKEVLVPFLRSASADLNFTLAIAILSVVITQIAGLIRLGFFKHVGKFINFSNPVNFFVGILELLAEFAKMISFSFRLFGNIFAGEVLLTIVTALVPYLVPVPFLFMELFVGLVQALVFSMLTLVFLKMATLEHGDHGESGHGSAHGSAPEPAAAKNHLKTSGVEPRFN
ncbi:F0F1 ATP synthase subunit A [Candidatus Uhrbacteria bacterium]|nr:F0F1 ATP synthase subunit A [Candidatus Uhrbacteria bacterium]